MPDPVPVTRSALRRALPIVAPVPMTDLPARVFTDAEWDRIRLGYASRDMDEKWDVFVEDRTAFLHRSWTGKGIYEATFAPDPAGGWRIEAAVVESDPERYRRANGEFDTVMLELVLTDIVLGQHSAGLRAEMVRLMRRDPEVPAGAIVHSNLGLRSEA